MIGQKLHLVDVAPLAMGFARRSMQAGVYRMAVHTLRQLAASDNTAFTALTSPVSDLAGEAHVQDLNPAAATQWQPGFVRPTGGSKRWRPVIAAARHGGRWSPPRLLAASLLRGMSALHRPCPIAGDWQVFHSLCDPLPSMARVRSRARALTVYDLTCFTHAETHLPITVKSVTSALRSLQDGAANWAVCISKHTRDELVRITGFPAARTAVAQPGVDGHFAPATAEAIAGLRQRYGLTRRPYLLCLSSLEPRKNFLGALRGFARHAANDKDTELILAGPAGWLNAPIAAEIAAAQVPVRHIGFIPDADLPALYSGACGFLYPSLAEGFGLPVLEAMACGTPVLTSNLSSLPEVAGDAAILVNPLDVQDISDGIARLLREGPSLAERGRERASRFTWGAYHEALLAAYATMSGAQAQP